MSPIIYTPHDCEKPEGNLPAGTLYQCPECDRVWELHTIWSQDSLSGVKEWTFLEDPRRAAILREARAKNNPPAIPTVTPDIVQLALETYWDHVDLRRDAEGEYTECAECGTGSYDFHTIMEHAREKAVEAVQDAMRGETHE